MREMPQQSLQNVPRCRFLGLALVLLVATNCPALADDEAVERAAEGAAEGAAERADQNLTITRMEMWSGVFSDSEQKFHYEVKSPQRLEGKFSWRFTFHRRTLSSGGLRLTVDPNRPTRVTVPLQIPVVKPGVILQAGLTIAVESENGSRQTDIQVPLWIFPPDPFVDRKQWLESLHITVFDPPGDTLDMLDAAEIPCDSLRSLAALEEVDEGLVIVGEGTSLERQRGLADVMLSLAARGVPVLCLAPLDGQIPWPGVADQENGGPPGHATLPQRVSLLDKGVIKQLDKRLDAVAWPPDGEMARIGFAVASDREEPVLQVTKSRRSWPWLDVRYARGRGRLVVVGFNLVEHWDAGPTPRYLLARLFEDLTKRDQTVKQPSRNQGRKE